MDYAHLQLSRSAVVEALSKATLRDHRAAALQRRRAERSRRFRRSVPTALGAG